MNDDIKTQLFSGKTWKRGFFMLVFSILWTVAELVLLAVAIFQFGCVLLSGKVNENATQLGNSLGQYIFQIAQYVTFNSNQQPFPFSAWPEPRLTPSGRTPRKKAS